MKYARQTLFYSVIIIFVATALVTLLGVTGVVSIKESYLNTLFGALIVELIASVIGLFKSTDWFGDRVAKPQDVHILGSWWQMLRTSEKANPGDNVISYVRIKYSSAQQQYIVEGDSYTFAGRPYASWRSVAVAFNVATNELWYVYAGDHERDAGDAKCIGYLKFSRSQNEVRPSRADGWFVSGNIEQLKVVKKTKYVFLPAKDDEVSAMNSKTSSRSAKGKIASEAYARWAGIETAMTGE